MNTERPRYAKSALLLERAEKCIPLGSQTFSKSRIQFPPGHAPLFLERGLGGRVLDVDGNWYVDLVCGLLPVMLGYQDSDVNLAVSRQLERGISFSLATELEIQVAERLVKVIPCAEMVRFGKNGSDATSAAVRLARAVTGRDMIAACGYHGWQDWYIGSTARDFGVPGAVKELTKRFSYGNIQAFEALLQSHPGKFAAVIMEPAGIAPPPAGYLDAVQELTARHGALLIFDEIISGFRLALGGAQELFGVTPDLACFGKSLGNGMPISAVVGRAEYMRRFEDVFFSGTFGGETLSLAAALAVLDKMEREPVIEHLGSTGRLLASRVQEHVKRFGLTDVFTITGYDAWKILSFFSRGGVDQYQIKTLLLTRLFDCGVLVNGSHNVCWAHDADDVDLIAAAYAKALEELASALDAGDLPARLSCPPVKPVFSVRG